MIHKILLRHQGGWGASYELTPGDIAIVSKVHPNSDRKVGDILCFRAGRWVVECDGELSKTLWHEQSTWRYTEWEVIRNTDEINLEDLL